MTHQFNGPPFPTLSCNYIFFLKLIFLFFVAFQVVLLHDFPISQQAYAFLIKAEPTTDDSHHEAQLGCL